MSWIHCRFAELNPETQLHQKYGQISCISGCSCFIQTAGIRGFSATVAATAATAVLAPPTAAVSINDETRYLRLPPTTTIVQQSEPRLSSDDGDA